MVFLIVFKNFMKKKLILQIPFSFHFLNDHEHVYFQIICYFVYIHWVILFCRIISLNGTSQSGDPQKLISVEVYIMGELSCPQSIL